MPPALDPLTRHAPTLRDALDNIRPKAKPEPVHRLRAILRRILAEFSLLPSSPKTANQIARFTRLAKPIIKAAGKTRDLDVHVDLLEKLPHNLQPEIDILSRHLLKKRRRRAAALRQLVRKNQKDLFSTFNKLQATSPDPSTPAPASSSSSVNGTGSPSPRALARDTFSHAADTLNPSQPDDLHELRKAARDSRYLAESESDGPPSAKHAQKSAAKSTAKHATQNRDAVHFHHIQQALGMWHDYLTLAESAYRYLPATSPLIPVIESLRDRHHRTALKALGGPTPPKKR